ncbi:carbohydrate binding domain-containing protein [Muricoccus radiodurans]|uniref:carbohydrate binding domain-containing protein n=1 Tax=Muricoccus radiodurans TaxID=2231721 RepID=UPI003CEBFB88
MLRVLLGTTALATSLVFAVSASAAIVTNGSFENGLNGWTTTGSGVTPGIGITVIETGGTNSTGYGDNVANYDGTHAAFFVDDQAVEDLFQSVSLKAGVFYSLSFALWATASGAANPFNFTLENSVGLNVLDTTGNSGNSTGVPVGTWTPYSYNFTVNSDDNYRLNFHFTSGLTPAKDVLLDGVAITAVPEPATLALFGAGLLGLGFVRRRKSDTPAA